jgi:hypothetical protein
VMAERAQSGQSGRVIRSGARVCGLVLSLALVSCGSVTSGCSPGKVRDPGSFHAESVVGRVSGSVSSGLLPIGGRSVQIDAATHVFGSCSSPDTPCDGRVVLRRDQKSAADVFYWSTDLPIISVFTINTDAYRFQGAFLLLSDGMRWAATSRLRIEGCGTNDEKGLMQAGVGATFRVDAANDVVVSAACNGCE